MEGLDSPREPQSGCHTSGPETKPLRRREMKSGRRCESGLAASGVGAMCNWRAQRGARCNAARTASRSARACARRNASVLLASMSSRSPLPPAVSCFGRLDALHRRWRRRILVGMLFAAMPAVAVAMRWKEPSVFVGVLIAFAASMICGKTLAERGELRAVPCPRCSRAGMRHRYQWQSVEFECPNCRDTFRSDCRIPYAGGAPERVEPTTDGG